MGLHRTDCRFFTGYRPCAVGGRCDGCEHFQAAHPEVLLINLDAMGDVLRTTALLPAIIRAHPDARITWLTRSRAAPMLRGNPLVHRVLEWGDDAHAILRVLRFDLVLNADKSLAAGAMAMTVNAHERRGFGIDDAGCIIPLNPEANVLYELGLDDHAKFRLNQRTAPDLLAEALGFDHEGDAYTLRLPSAAIGRRFKVGINTGCGPAWPMKKMAMSSVERLVQSLVQSTGEPVLLLGGPEDAEDHQRLCDSLGRAVERSEINGGVMRGAAELDRCDVVVSGDTLGMHMAIALEKHVVAWFGPTCPAEIDLYGRGVKVLAEVGCAPCYRPSCPEEVPCASRVDTAVLHGAALDCLRARREGKFIGEVRGASWWRPVG